MNYDIDMLLQIWKELRPHLIGGDVEAAAYDFVHVLFEHGVAAEELAGYALDPELKEALRDFTDEDLDYEDEDEDEDELNFD